MAVYFRLTTQIFGTVNRDFSAVLITRDVTYSVEASVVIRFETLSVFQCMYIT